MTSTTSYLPGLDGGMLASVTGGAPVVALADLHGDTPLTATTSQAVAPDGATTDTDEYGQVRDAAGAPTTGPRYAWLGTAQRDATAGSGLTFMGVRVYNPATGRFLTTDPVRGGGSNTYGYPTDPVNASDTTGTLWHTEDITWAERWIIARQAFPKWLLYVYGAAGLFGQYIGSRYNDRDGRGNAARHLVWQLSIGSIWGVALAGRLASAHEGTSKGPDHRADLANNQLARVLVANGSMPSVSMWWVASLGIWAVTWVLNRAKSQFWLMLRQGRLACVTPTKTVVAC